MVILFESLLASYFYSEYGDFEFEQLKKIEQFPVNENFEKIGINISDKFEVAKNYIKAQEEINKTKKLSFGKPIIAFVNSIINIIFLISKIL